MSVRSVATAELARIQAEHGNLTPEMIVEEARSRTSPLHHLFEWDNRVAGEKYRLGQARVLVRIVREEIGEDDDGAPIYFRAYVAARRVNREEAGYLPTREVLMSPISEAILAKALKRELARINQKYGHLRLFGQIVRGELGELAG
jgi:hypothetical protein